MPLIIRSRFLQINGERTTSVPVQHCCLKFYESMYFRATTAKPAQDYYVRVAANYDVVNNFPVGKLNMYLNVC